MTKTETSEEFTFGYEDEEDNPKRKRPEVKR
jgi:hypothetical protein